MKYLGGISNQYDLVNKNYVDNVAGSATPSANKLAKYDSSGRSTVKDFVIKLDTNAASGTDDYELIGLITDLGWSDVMSGGNMSIKKLLIKILLQFRIG